MRKLLRRLRKGLKTACLTAALTTCWQIGQVAKADITPPDWGDEVTIRISGTVSPAINDLTHVFFIYGTGYSSLGYGPWAVKLGDFPAGQSTDFSVQGTAIYQESLFWYTAGLYGDISSGLYIEGVNGVTLGINATEGDPWNWHFPLNEQETFTQLLNDTPGSNFASVLDGGSAHAEWMTGLEFNSSSILFNFSNASNNGLIQITSEVVPEPVSIVLFGTGGMIVVALRRRNK